ncbi:MAG: hypothetical protein ACFFDW_09845 [Candidatus Thorarchaeota archaeon]
MIINTYDDVAISILYQQLFLDPNLIRDRRNTVRITVNESTEIINKMRLLILEDISLFDTGKEYEYIIALTAKIAIDPKIIIREYKEKLSPLQKNQLTDKSFRYLLLISSVIKELQEKSTKEVIKQLEFHLKSRMNKEEVKEKLDQLSQKSDTDFSLLLNLGILNSYAKIMNIKPAKGIFSEYLQKVIQAISE